MIFFPAQAVYTVEVGIALRGVTYKGSGRFDEFCSFSSTRKLVSTSVRQPLFVASKFLLIIVLTPYYVL